MEHDDSFLDFIHIAQMKHYETKREMGCNIHNQCQGVTDPKSVKQSISPSPVHTPEH